MKSKGMMALGVSVDKLLQNTKTYFQKYNFNFASVWLNQQLKSAN